MKALNDLERLNGQFARALMIVTADSDCRLLTRHCSSVLGTVTSAVLSLSHVVTLMLIRDAGDGSNLLRSVPKNNQNKAIAK